ncbi:MAG: hypothetical protein EOP35_16765 [Rubrivivax sp.]|nr:MAG: hypothetical protein EOP35_16765 [Rubrivivax sp.]
MRRVRLGEAEAQLVDQLPPSLSARLAMAVDSVLGIERLAVAMKSAGAKIDVFIEVNVGHGHCGTTPTLAAALARQVVAHVELNFAGLQAYHGDAQHLRTPLERSTAIRDAISAGSRSALRRELVVPIGASGYVLKYEIAAPELVIVRAVRHRHEADYH